MTKKIIAIAILIMTLLLTGCQGGNDNAIDEKNELGEFVFRGRVTGISSTRYIEMEIIDSEIAFGTYHVLVSDQTTVYDKKGNSTSIDYIKIGDVIDVVFSGQVMNSYPPKISAQKIVIN